MVAEVTVYHINGQVSFQANTISQVNAHLSHHNLDEGWLSVGGMPLSAFHLQSAKVCCDWNGRVRGGKGAFGRELKQEGERISKESKDSKSKENYKNLKGQKLKTINKAKLLSKRNPAIAKITKKQDKIQKLESILRPAKYDPSKAKTHVNFQINLANTSGQSK